MKSIRIAAAMALLSPVVCQATLGAAPSPSASVTTTPATSRAALTAPASSAAYTLHETQTTDGVTVREYTSAANVVFAVTWQGPTRPDMQALLGSYFPNLIAAGQRIARGTGPLVVRDGELRVESVGHQGAFAGRAWVPRLVPANVNVDALQ
ncbi:DUF2844 domain-containing protein [Paraburkholderia azotifigens]|uniref:DUF2844 domain-containing protein n=1 Tax=Paraburkholderia azotifigens TaxID=2057004 RepID=A0ABU9QZH0_9BURK